MHVMYRVGLLKIKRYRSDRSRLLVPAGPIRVFLAIKYKPRNGYENNICIVVTKMVTSLTW